MANLRFLFEAVWMYPELQEEFDSEIVELPGIKRLVPINGIMFLCLIQFLQQYFNKYGIQSKRGKR